MYEKKRDLIAHVQSHIHSMTAPVMCSIINNVRELFGHAEILMHTENSYLIASLFGTETNTKCSAGLNCD